MLHLERKKMLSVGALLLACAIGAIAIVMLAQSSDATSAPTESASSTFAVLEPATPAAMDAVSEQTKMRMDFMAMRLDVPTSEAVDEVGVVTRENGPEVTVAAIGGNICAYLAGGIGGCDDQQRVVAGHAFGAEPVGCDGYRVLAVVPNGIEAIAVDSGADGDVDTSLPVESNIYVGVLDPVRTLVTGLDESGEARFRTEIPLDSYASMNDGCQ
jgi:hypothetical protein